MDRPADLRRALQSILHGELRPDEIVVSDDSRNPELTESVVAEFAMARYLRGPCTGLGANRQFGGLSCRSDYVCFVDDDALVSPDFLRLMSEAARSLDGRTLLSGDVLEGGVERVSPRNLSFWGTFEKEPGGLLQNINLNSNAIPRVAFESAAFDPRIKYGYEDADFCAQLIARGFRIVHVAEAVNRHMSSPENRVENIGHREHARYYSSLKRYLVIRRRFDLAIAFAILAPLQQGAHRFKHGRWRSVPQVGSEFSRALVDVARHAFSRREPSSSAEKWTRGSR